jgi:hypothetical protein
MHWIAITPGARLPQARARFVAGAWPQRADGETCDWTSGYEEPAGALLGLLLGVGIGALWPHD